jgi:rod shape-determining protein MreD
MGTNLSAPTTRRRLTGLYLAAGLMALAVLCQATLLPRLRFFDARGNLVLVLVVVWSLLRNVDEGLILAFFGGLAVDAISGLPLGASSLALMIVSMLTSLGEGNFFQGNVFLALFAVGVATPVHGWMLLLVRQMRGVPLDWAGTTLHVMLPELLLNIILASAVYPLLHRVVRRLGGDRLEW